MLQNDLDFLSAAAAARMFSSLLWISQAANPVEGISDFEARSRQLLADMEAGLSCAQSGMPVGVLARKFEENARGNYDHDVVGVALEQVLMDLQPAFVGLPQDASSAILRWLRESGSTEHGLAWLLEQASSLLVADAVVAPSAVH